MGAPDHSVNHGATGKPLSDVDRDNLAKARAAYQKLLDDAEKDPKLAPSESSVLATRLQLGECYRALGQYQEALDTFSSILKDKETSLIVQRAAAYTYQERGQNEDPQWLERAIHGGYQVRATGQNRIWGWLKISQVAARVAKSDQKYHDAFYEARVNVARCRYLAAMKTSGDERRQDLAKAKQSIQSLAQLYPELGGDQWRAQFDDLLKQIQSAAGEEANGLREFSAREPAASDGQQRRG
jgi:tetratricopeptide (TPR) repeat protein